MSAARGCEGLPEEALAKRTRAEAQIRDAEAEARAELFEAGPWDMPAPPATIEFEVSSDRPKSSLQGSQMPSWKPRRLLQRR